MTTGSPPTSYAPPAGLTDVEAAATCQADVTITIREPMVTRTDSNSPAGMDWTGVEGVTVSLSGGGHGFTAKTAANGRVSFAAVPCGNYTVALVQAEFAITSLGHRQIVVSGSRKDGSDFDIKITRKLLTVEMFRLQTLFGAIVRNYLGISTTVNQDPYGHHWIKIFGSESDAARERPRESYGWWPIEPASEDRLWDGVAGSLNGYPIHSTNPRRDPDHNAYLRADKKLEDVFFPTVTNGKTAAQYKADIRTAADAYAGVSGNIWSWRTDAAGFHCKTFQTYVMREVRLWKRVGVGVGSFGWSANT